MRIRTILYWFTMLNLLAYINWPEPKREEFDVQKALVELQHKAESVCSKTALLLYGDTAVAEISCVDTECTCEIEIEGEREKEPEGQSV